MNRINRLLPLVALAIGLVSCTYRHPEVKVYGEYKQWHTLLFALKGNYTSEFDENNPFLNYRLDITFYHGKDTLVVPGYFAADGTAAESGASAGNIWHVRFTPGMTGHWTYKVYFRRGQHIAVSDSTNWGVPLPLDGFEGSFDIGPTDKTGRDFRAKGRIVDGGNHYMRFSGDGNYFIKAGADSPENFLACADFDQTPGTHRYEPHRNDWSPGDLEWGNGKGKTITGAVNYLSSRGMNSVYMMVMNVMGDGKDVWPWSDPYERTRYDVSKLAQWEKLFDYMEIKGVLLHLVLQETENELLLDQGENGITRRLLYRELVARFSHHLGVIWNLGEENGPADWTPLGQNEKMRKEMAAYLKHLIPYPSIVMLHTHADLEHQENMLTPLLGNVCLNGPSLQIGLPGDIHERITRWRYLSETAGRKWVCNLDEQGPYTTGIKPDAVDPDHDEARRDCLWGSLMAGAGGVEWYFGYRYDNNDLNCEDWRSREKMWDQTAIAREFFETLPLEQMKPADVMLRSSGAWCFADPDSVIVVYLPDKRYEFQLKDVDRNGIWHSEWLNPENGKKQAGDDINVNEGRCSIVIPGGISDKDLVCKLVWGSGESGQ